MVFGLSQRRVVRFAPFVFIILSYLAVGLDTISYPGFFGKHFLLDSRLLAFLSLVLLSVLFFTKTGKLSKFHSRFISVNSLFILPSLIVSAGVLTILERLRYPNFVFTTLHIHHDHLFYALLLSVAIYIFSLKKVVAEKHRKTLLIWLSVFLIYLGLLMKIWEHSVFVTLSAEDGLFEWLEFLFFLITSFSSLVFTIRSFRKKDFLTAVTYGGFALLFFFIAGEEISWGQRIFHTASPDIMLQYNVQKETTLHNLKGIQEKRLLFYMIFSSYFSFSWVLVRHFSIKINKQLRKFIPPWYLSLFFVPMFLITLLGYETNWQEYYELLLSLGVFLYIWETSRKKFA